MDGGDRRARPHQGVDLGQDTRPSCRSSGCRFLLFRRDLFGIPIYKLGLVLTGIAAVLTLWSMILYLRLAWPELRGSARL